MEIKSMNYNDAVKAAAELCGPDILPDGLKEEYVRGQVELICDLFGILMDDKEKVLADMQAVDLERDNMPIAIFTATITVEFEKSDDNATAAQDALNEYAVENDILKAFDLERIEGAS